MYNAKRCAGFHPNAPFLFLSRCCLFFADCAYGASVLASSAIYAFVVDNVDTVIPKNDRAHRASICACAASDAIFRDYVCHISTSVFVFLFSGFSTVYYYSIFFSDCK